MPIGGLLVKIRITSRINNFVAYCLKLYMHTGIFAKNADLAEKIDGPNLEPLSGLHPKWSTLKTHAQV